MFTPFPLSLSLSSKGPQNPRVFPSCYWSDFANTTFLTIGRHLRHSGEMRKFSCCMEGSTDVRLCWTMNWALTTLEIKEMCATPWGKIRNDSQTVVSQPISEQLHCTQGLGIGWGTHSSRCAASQLLLITKVLKLVSESLVTVIHQTRCAFLRGERGAEPSIQFWVSGSLASECHPNRGPNWTWLHVLLKADWKNVLRESRITNFHIQSFLESGSLYHERGYRYLKQRWDK